MYGVQMQGRNDKPERKKKRLDGSVANWEKDILLSCLDALWADYMRDAEQLQLNVMMRSFSGLSPIDEFRLEAGAAPLCVQQVSDHFIFSRSWNLAISAAVL